jgi:hypothetical protein
VVVDVFLLTSVVHSSGEAKVLRSLFANGKEMSSESHAAYWELSQLALGERLLSA